MSFIYAVSLGISGSVEYARDDYQMQNSTVIMGNIPCYICNVIIFAWIALAFRRTLL